MTLRYHGFFVILSWPQFAKLSVLISNTLLIKYYCLFYTDVLRAKESIILYPPPTLDKKYVHYFNYLPSLASLL